MSSLKYVDQLKFESLFGMKSGYVLDFSNRTFRDFFIATIEFDIYAGTDAEHTPSKANLLREFWSKAGDSLVAKVNKELLDHWRTITTNKTQSDITLFNSCLEINDALMGSNGVQNIEALTEAVKDDTLDMIVNEIKRNIADNNPHLSLDRLHTFMMNFGRNLCNKHGVNCDASETINAIYGKYNKWLNETNALQSRMPKKIIGNAVSLLEDFNHIRNNQSAAHDNPILNKHESLLVVESICSIVNFINKIEDILSCTISQGAKPDDQIPF